MHDIRQFKPVLYTLIILGISGFALAWESTGLWVLAMAAIGVNAWLVKTGRFAPMPRFIANISIILGLFLLVLMIRHGTEKIMIVGEFLVLLQIVKLYEQRANRDYSQLLILSLLLMVSAAISTASVVFGVMLIAYLFLSLYCSLLFHLKVETDHATEMIGRSDIKSSPASIQLDQQHLSRSMRRLTAAIAFFSSATAILIFIFFPRGPSAALLGAQQWQPAQTLTGFSDQVNFQTVARITQNTQAVAWVKVTKNGAPYSDIPLLFRGLTLDHYSGKTDNEYDSPYQWTRNIPELLGEELTGGQWHPYAEESGDQLRQEVTLNPTGTYVLFAMPGIVAFRPDDTLAFRYSPQDQALRSVYPMTQQIHYQVISNGQLTVPYYRPVRARRTANIDPKIEEFARMPAVCGADANGPLAAQRDPDAVVSPLDAKIAHNMESYLRTNFAYTLDLTDAARIEGQDPLVAFLYDLKRGHCEYFAGAMTLMCQSLGMQARMVVGFKCDEYNSIGKYYTVRQSHAHAWVEVLDARGDWETFDPTSSNEELPPPPDTFAQKARKLFDFFQYTWANSVIAYDSERRDNIVQTVDRKMLSSVVQGSDFINRLGVWFSVEQYLISSGVIAVLIALMVLILLCAVLWFTLEKWRLRRRAHRIGLDALPANQQLRLAKQLGFYDELLLLLERRRIVRPPQLTPLEFSDSLVFLPSDAFSSVRRLTDAFYIVRYGHAELSAQQRRHLLDILAGVATSLESGKRSI